MFKSRPPKYHPKEDAKTFWERKAKGRSSEDDILLGTNIETRGEIFISPKQLSTHLHILGSTGAGKSFFMEGIIKRIMKGHGLCLIDPHGDLYERMMIYCAYLHHHRPELKISDRVIPINIADTRHVLAFNPMARNARVMTYQVVAMMEAIRKCWGQDDFNATPRLARWLFNTCYALIDSKLTMVQMYRMLDPKPNDYRQAIITRIKNPLIKAEWEWISGIKEEKKEERLESTFNRMQLFITQEIIRNIIGQHTATIDFPSVLNDKKIVLVNLARQSAINQENRHMLGTLLINELLTAAFARPMGERTPFYLFIDEFEDFVTKDVCEILDGGRKFGIHLIAGHQHLHQLKEKDPEVYYSTMTNARTKVVFGGLSDEDLKIMGPELYTGDTSIDPFKVKQEIWRVAWDPVESTRIVYSESHSESTSHSESEGQGTVNHESLAEGESYIPASHFWSDPTLVGTSVSGTAGQSVSSSHQKSDGSSTSDSFSRSEVPWYEFHKRMELQGREFQSLEEQFYQKIAYMKRQKQQHAAVLIPDTSVQLMVSETLADFSKKVSQQQRQDFLSEAIEKAGCFKPPEQAAAEIEALEQKLLADAKPVIEIKAEEKKSKSKAKAKKENPLKEALRKQQAEE